MPPYKCFDTASSQPNKLLSFEALQRAQTLVRQVADLACNRRNLLQSDARASVRLSIIGALPSYEMPGRGIIELPCSTVVATLEQEIAKRQEELMALGVEPPAIEPRPPWWNEPYDVNRVARPVLPRPAGWP